MKHKLKKLFIALSSAAMLSITIVPKAHALKSVPKIVEIINALLRVFRGAGIILLAYSVIALILAIKDENADSKVQASMQMAVALVCITLSTIMKALAASVGVSLNLK